MSALVRRPGRRARRLCWLASIASLLVGLRAEEPWPGPAAQRAAPPLEVARASKRALRGARGSALATGRLRAIAAYLTAADGTRGDERAGALLRAGELARAAGDEGRARELFERAARVPGATTFASRARLERAHVDRRAGSWEAALDAYEALVADSRVERPLRDDAQRWCATICDSLGRHDEARRRWRWLSTNARSTANRVRAFDRMTLSWLAEGDAARARATLAECDAALAARAAELTEAGAKLRGALARMSSRARLREPSEHSRAR